MASIVANLPPSLLVNGRRQPIFRSLRKFTVSAILGNLYWVFVPVMLGAKTHFTNTAQTLSLLGGTAGSEKQRRVAVVTKATGESSESSTSLSVIKSVKNVWDKSEDRIALIGLGFAAVVGIWASSNLITAIDKLPFIPGAFEFIGILFSTWFTYRYLLFKPDREELLQTINESISDILGQ